MTLLIGFFLLSIIFSFLCSIWEAVLLSVTPSYVKVKENESPAVGQLLAQLKADIDKPLSAILTLNTIAHTVGAIGVGAQAGQLFGTSTIGLAGVEITYESIIATLMTLAILFLSEIIPKTLGANNWKQLAPFTARSLRGLMFVLHPFVWLSNQLAKILKKDKSKSVFSRQDFAAMAEVVEESGEIAPEDLLLITNVLKFDELTARDVMTPRIVMVMADENQRIQEFYEQHQTLRFSRIPLYSKTRDTISGLFLQTELFRALLNGKGDEPLHSIRREVQVVPYNSHLRKVFVLLHEKREHLAIVVGEYGEVIGLVTLEDVIETLLGLEIMDESDSVSDLQSYARKKWEERAKKLGIIK